MSQEKNIWRQVLFAILFFFSPFNTYAREEKTADYGFIFDRFKLTLADGWRSEAAGPFFYSQQSESEKILAFPPFFSRADDPAVESHEDDFLYPLMTYERYGKEYRWQFAQLLSFSGGQQADGAGLKRFTIYPLYFQQRSPDPAENYTAVVPFYGHIKDRLLFPDVYFILFPIYSETRRQGVVTDNYFYPIVHVRRGDGLHGWQVWPIVGREHKDVTTQTNGFGDSVMVPGHDKLFFLWPVHLREHTGIGSENPATLTAEFPVYLATRSPQRDATTVLWPLFNWIDEREKKYREWQMPWPLVIFARGEGKTTSRIFPLFSQSHNAEREADFYVWPLYEYHRLHAGLLDQQHTQILIYLYSDKREKNMQTGAEKRRVDMWPFITWHHDFNGNERLQVFAPIEPAVPDNRGLERNWSPLWSVWRAEANGKTGATSQSLLWNLYRHEAGPAHKKISLLFGLFQYQCDDERSRTRWFYFTVSQTRRVAK
jgi:hypothetical protein